MKVTQKTFALAATIVALTAFGRITAQTTQPEEGFVSLFDGKSLEGWRVGDNASVFSAHDGMIVMECTNRRCAHLFYDGEVKGGSFKNFDLRVEVMTYPGANSGIYFHTRYQEEGFPVTGIECQVDISHSDWRRSGSLYGIKELTWGPEAPDADDKEDKIVFETPPIKDNVWYLQEVICDNGNITVKMDGKTMYDYKLSDPAVEHQLPSGMMWLTQGTFALQGHPAMTGHISKACFRNIRVKVLPD
jgi:hypothetical protein